MISVSEELRPGVRLQGGGRASFTVWAPSSKGVSLKILSSEERIFQMEKDDLGYWRATADGVQAGSLYLYRLDGGNERPDPASHLQPEGVHGPSEVVDHSVFRWTDGSFTPPAFGDMILYEIHVGTFTPEGTFAAAADRLEALKEIGVNAIELMPVAAFPGERNWGYDGVYPFAVQASYGGPGGLKDFVDSAHSHGMAVVLDVVYNHLGPEGNYLQEFGPYFTDKYRSPWGMAVNFDDAMSDEVRRFFIENALHWFENYHVDALRLDAIHGIYDMSATPFLADLSRVVEEFGETKGRDFHLVAESDSNDVRTILPREGGGLGLYAQWSDDYHHAVHTLLTGERGGYYGDFGKASHLAKALREGFVYSGQYSEYRRRSHGSSSAGRPSRRMVVFSQNHDQVGNRMNGERLSNLVSFEALKLAAGAVLLSPFVPLLFMGEEYGESAPFLYFVSHGDAALIDAVREGRKREFAAFNWGSEPPDPQSGETFAASKLDWELRGSGRGGLLLSFYRELIGIRNRIPALSSVEAPPAESVSLDDSGVVCFSRSCGKSRVACLMHFGRESCVYPFPFKGEGWRLVLDSADPRWGGPGSRLSDRIGASEDVAALSESVALYSLEGK
ncbi:MAG TPA: malto-oligosyltrehalose trehalohydrolase [bacterium]|nr:malto-oligosyltrehalose trehalohydrolase [bacterium]